MEQHHWTLAIAGTLRRIWERATRPLKTRCGNDTTIMVPLLTTTDLDTALNTASLVAGNSGQVLKAALDTLNRDMREGVVKGTIPIQLAHRFTSRLVNQDGKPLDDTSNPPPPNSWLRVTMPRQDGIHFHKLIKDRESVVRQETTHTYWREDGTGEESPVLSLLFPHPDNSPSNPKMPLAEVKSVAGPDPHIVFRADYRNDQFDLHDELTAMTARALAATLLEAVEWLEDRLETNREEKEKEERK